jgi:hypothetical protein
VLETNDNYRWMDKTSHELSVMAKQFADVGGRPCCTEEGRRWIAQLRLLFTSREQPTQQHNAANFPARDHAHVDVLNPVPDQDSPEPSADLVQPDATRVQRLPQSEPTRAQRLGHKALLKVHIALARQAARRGVDGGEEEGVEMGAGRHIKTSRAVAL